MALYQQAAWESLRVIQIFALKLVGIAASLASSRRARGWDDGFSEALTKGGGSVLDHPTLSRDR